jgi:hypothetical protein
MAENHENSSSASRGPSDAAHPQDDAPDDARARFKKTLIRVMAVQVVTLLLLGYLQYLFTP